MSNDNTDVNLWIPMEVKDCRVTTEGMNMPTGMIVKSIPRGASSESMVFVPGSYIHIVGDETYHTCDEPPLRDYECSCGKRCDHSAKDEVCKVDQLRSDCARLEQDVQALLTQINDERIDNVNGLRAIETWLTEAGAEGDSIADKISDLCNKVKRAAK